MTTQKTNTQTTIKTDLIKVVQRNYIENKQNEELERELTKSQRKAKAYSRKCEKKRKRKERLYAIITGIIGAGLLFALVSCSETENRYAIAREQGNGIHYVYVTERKCEVTEVTEDLVTVEYKGNLYGFYAHDTELKVGDDVICKFTDNWEIIGTK